MRNRIGLFLLELRRARQMSLGQLAARAHVAASTLSRWEAGAYQPRLPELEAVLTALCASPEQRARALGLLDAPRGVQRLRVEAEEVAAERGDDPVVPICGGDLLRALRKRSGLSLEQVAARLGVKPNTVSRWEQSETIPCPQRQEALLDVLGAYPEERETLSGGTLLLAPPLEDAPATLEALEQQLDALTEQAQQGECALMDLRFLMLEARLAPLARLRPSARRLLAMAYTWHAQWLSWWDRYADVGRYAGRALNLAGSGPPREEFWIRAVHTSGVAAVCKSAQENPRRGLDTLRGWLPIATHPQYATWLYRDMADYASRAGQSAAALDLIGYARADAQRTEDPGTIHLSKYVHADILVRCGRPAEAVPLLEDHPPCLPPFQHALDHLKAAEALLALESRPAAQEHLERAYAIIDAYRLTHYRPGADRLACQV